MAQPRPLIRTLLRIVQHQRQDLIHQMCRQQSGIVLVAAAFQAPAAATCLLGLVPEATPTLASLLLQQVF